MEVSEDDAEAAAAAAAALKAEHDALLTMYQRNRSMLEPWLSVSATAYAILIFVTLLGNTLVIWAVLRRKELWNPRNIFIWYLAVSGICESSV